MKSKILLFFFSILFLNAWSNTLREPFTDISLRKRAGSNPYAPMKVTGTPVTAYFANNVIYITLSKVEEFAIVNITDKETGEIVFSNTFENTKDITIDASLIVDGEYTIEIVLSNKQYEGELIL